MFTPFKNDGGLQPWEYLPAKEGTYQGGQLLNASAGMLTPVSSASTTTPGYLCMADITVAEGESIPASSAAEELPAPLPESLPLTALPAAAWDLDGDGEKELVCLEGQALFFRMEEDGPAAYALAQPLAEGQTLTAQDGVFVLADSSGRSRIYSVFRDGALWPAG